MIHESFLKPAVNRELGVYGFGDGGFMLAGMPYPRSADEFEGLHGLGFEKIVCLTDYEPRYYAAPLEVIAAVPLEDLCGGGEPASPEAEECVIRQVAEVTAASVERGEPVVIHSDGGTGRTDTVLGATLRQLGCTWEPVRAAMTELNRLRGPWARGWPESPWQESLVRDWRKGG